MIDGDTPEKPAPRKRRWAYLPFVALFLGGFVVFALKNFSQLPEISFQSLFPLLGGAVVAVAVVWIVIRDRQGRHDDEDGGES